jgi:hypothetical protein
LFQCSPCDPDGTLGFIADLQIRTILSSAVAHIPLSSVRTNSVAWIFVAHGLGSISGNRTARELHWACLLPSASKELLPNWPDPSQFSRLDNCDSCNRSIWLTIGNGLSNW